MEKFWNKIFIPCVSIAVFFLITASQNVSAATLSLSPGHGTFEVGSTFDVSIMLNTQGKSVNAVKATLFFSPDSLQVVSPANGQSVVSLWASPPAYNNSKGAVNLEGGFPNAINVSKALIANVTFRVKGTGPTIIKFNDESKVLLDDGKGTDDLSQTNNGIYTLTLPPPAGPEVVSETHPDQSRWYNSSSVTLKWADPDPSLAEKYSYILSGDPSEIPDDIPEGDNVSVAYENISDGRHYFHIKALNGDKIWGGVTHYALNVDKNPPAGFSVDIFPSSSTDRKNPMVQFITTDGVSGVDHYELKIIPLDFGEEGEQETFFEVNSPYLSQNMAPGRYDVIVRAYDKAFNYRESVKHLRITNPIFRFASSDGVAISERTLISWPLLFLGILSVIFLLGYVSWRLRHHHRFLEASQSDKRLPVEIRRKAEELRELKKKYKHFTMALVFFASQLFLVFSAQADVMPKADNPPLITTISRNISNDEIFYAGGRLGAKGEKITLYIKNATTGETFSEEALPDDRGEWFYRHDTFLTEGEYVLWAQGKIGEESSPPSPQVEMSVRKTAFQIGSSRLSYELLFVLAVVALLLVIGAMIFHILISAKKIRKKSRIFRKEINEVESAVHRGFLLLHQEISKELKLLEGAGAKINISEEESAYRQHLMNDLKKIEQHIEKEIADVEKLLQ